MDIEITSDRSAEVLSELAEKKARALEACGLTAEGYAIDNCPVDTGRLRNSITYATHSAHDSGRGAPAESSDYSTHETPDEDTVCIGTNVEYAAYVEMGTSKQSAQPYLKPAFADHASKYRDIIKGELEG